LASNIAKKFLHRLAYLAHCEIESGLIGARRLAESAHLADELERGGGDFFAGCGRLRPTKDFDASAHTCHHMK
jgi:hypothetical protein